MAKNVSDLMRLLLTSAVDGSEWRHIYCNATKRWDKEEEEEALV